MRGKKKQSTNRKKNKMQKLQKARIETKEIKTIYKDSIPKIRDLM